MDSGLSVDSKELLNKFKQLQGKEKDKIVRQSVGKALYEIKKATINQMAKEGIPVNKPNKTYGFTPADGVTMAVYKDGSGGSVAIMKNYLLRFLEKGTSERSYKTKNGVDHYIGRIEPKWFFRNAINQTKNSAINILNESLSQGIEKLWNNKS